MNLRESSPCPQSTIPANSSEESAYGRRKFLGWSSAAFATSLLVPCLLPACAKERLLGPQPTLYPEFLKAFEAKLNFQIPDGEPSAEMQNSAAVIFAAQNITQKETGLYRSATDSTQQGVTTANLPDQSAQQRILTGQQTAQTQLIKLGVCTPASFAHGYNDFLVRTLPQMMAAQGILALTNPIFYTDKSGRIVATELEVGFYKIKAIRTESVNSFGEEIRGAVIETAPEFRVNGENLCTFPMPPAFTLYQTIFIRTDDLTNQPKIIRAAAADTMKLQLADTQQFIGSLTRLPSEQALVAATAYSGIKALQRLGSRNFSDEAFYAHVLAHEFRHLRDMMRKNVYHLTSPYKLSTEANVVEFCRNRLIHCEINGMLGELRDSKISDFAIGNICHAAAEYRQGKSLTLHGAASEWCLENAAEIISADPQHFGLPLQSNRDTKLQIRAYFNLFSEDVQERRHQRIRLTEALLKSHEAQALRNLAHVFSEKRN